MTGPHLYDVLDVDPEASSEEIREAWRTAIADLTPADRRFRLYNDAAEVLLDPQRRAAYDAELAAAAPDEEPEANRASMSESEGTPVSEAAGHGAVTRAWGALRHRRTSPVEAAERNLPWVPTWLLAGLVVCVLLTAGLAAYLSTQPSQSEVEEATGSARAAAERHIVPVLSYDYETLSEDRAAAEAVVTDDYFTDDYEPLFEVIENNAPRIEAVVDVEVISSAVVRAGEERAQILLFVNRPTTNAETEQPVIYKDQVTVTMQRVDGEWLVDAIATSPLDG